MKRNTPGYSWVTPFVLWNDIAIKTAEMMLSSAQVIGHRTTRMALAGPEPSARDRREFALMTREKVEAGGQSAQAMAAHIATLYQPWGVQAFRDTLRCTAALISLASSRTPGQVIARQTVLARALGESALGMAGVSKNAARFAHRGLKPIHAKATANAKRLGARSRA